jgi:hypothetical protein
VQTVVRSTSSWRKMACPLACDASLVPQSLGLERGRGAGVSLRRACHTVVIHEGVVWYIPKIQFRRIATAEVENQIGSELD